MNAAKDRVRIALQVVVYVALWWAMAALAGFVFGNVLDYFPAIVFTSLVAACFANWVSMRIYERKPLADIGLWWNGPSMRNMALGLAGGAGAAALVLAGPLAAGVARLQPGRRRVSPPHAGVRNRDAARRRRR